MNNEWVIHIDGDGFFAYCEIARFPQYKGMPVVVGVDRGIACAMTYEAKRLGVTRGMPIFKIREQFPEVVVLSSHFELYEHYARKLFMIVEPFVTILERYSIDECFALVSLPHAWSKQQVYIWLSNIKKKVHMALGITFSFGIARTKVLAKIASKYEKPDGCSVFFPQDEEYVLKQVLIGDVWGIGRSMGPRIQREGIQTAYDFTRMDERTMTRLFATPIQSIWYELRGVRVFGVETVSSKPKSLQSTKSFVPSSTERAFVTAELLQNIDIVSSRMRRYGVVTNAISIFLKNTDRRYKGAYMPLPYFTNNPIDIAQQMEMVLDEIYSNGMRYKATGVTVLNLCSEQFVPHDFFDEQQAVIEKGSLMKTVDHIRQMFGTSSIGMLGALPSTLDRMQKRNILAQSAHYIPNLPLPYMGEVE